MIRSQVTVSIFASFHKLVYSYIKSSSMESSFFISVFMTMVLNLVLQTPGYSSHLSTCNHLHDGKSYINTDREIYQPGDKIFYSVVIIQPIVTHTIYYVELISSTGLVIDRKKTRVIDNKGNGTIQLHDTLVPGTYWIRGFTRTVPNGDPNNSYSKQIHLVDGLPDNLTYIASSGIIDTMLFYPEGGRLVVGHSSKITAVAIDHDKFTCSFQGYVIDSYGDTICFLSTDSFGLASFELNPQATKTYTAEIYSDRGQKKKFNLSVTKELESKLSVSHINEETIEIQLEVGSDFDHGHLRGIAMGKIYFEEQILSNHYVKGIDLTEFPPGIIQFSYWDREDKINSERLIFNSVGLLPCYVDIDNRVEESDSNYSVDLFLDLYDQDGLPCICKVDIKIYADVLPYLPTQNVIHYFWIEAALSSDYQQHFRFPEHLMYTEEASIDHYLMTQSLGGLIDALLKSDANDSTRPHLEDKLSLSGTLYRKNRPYETKGFWSVMSDLLTMQEFASDSKGHFKLDDLEIYDTTDIVFYFMDQKSSSNPVNTNFKTSGNSEIRIEIDTPNLANHVDINKLALGTPLDAPTNTHANAAPESIIIDLDEIQVRAKRLDIIVEYHKKNMLYARPSSRIILDTLLANRGYTNIIDLLRGRVPNFEVSSEEGSPKVYLRGRATGLSKSAAMSNAANFMVDGSSVSQAYVEAINPTDIAFVDILRGLSETSVYGEYGRNGLIMIYLKPPMQRSKKMLNRGNILSHQIIGFARSLPFAVQESSVHNIPTSLYWNATWQTDNRGTAEISFSVPKHDGSYFIVAEGITTNGQPFFTMQKLQIP